jgi:hypothetical protein
MQITNEIHFSVYDVFYSLNSHKHVLATVAAIFRVILLLLEYIDINVVSCNNITTLKVAAIVAEICE